MKIVEMSNCPFCSKRVLRHFGSGLSDEKLMAMKLMGYKITQSGVMTLCRSCRHKVREATKTTTKRIGRAYRIFADVVGPKIPYRCVISIPFHGPISVARKLTRSDKNPFLFRVSETLEMTLEKID